MAQVIEAPQPDAVPAPSVLIVDDHRLFGDAMSSALAAKGMHVVGVATSTNDAVLEAARSSPDLALVDVDLPDGSGIDAGKAIMSISANSVVLVMASRPESQLVRDALAAGLHGLVTKEASLARLLAATSAALAGQTVVPSDVARSMRPRTPEEERIDLLRRELTTREREVLALLAEGSSTEQIMARLGLTHNTVRTHVGRVLTKLQAHSRLEAAAFALRHGLVEHHGRPA